MDERKLKELFNEAVPDTPPPSFDYADVAAESGRQSRRRTALLGGTTLGIVVLAGAVVLGVALWRGTDAGVSAPAAEGPLVADGGTGNGKAVPNDEPREDASASDQQNVPPGMPKQGGSSTGNASPRAGSTSSGCGQADVELAAALAGELPSAASSSPTVVDIPCPEGARGVALSVDGGTISMVVGQADAQFTDPRSGQPEGSALRVVPTRDGRVVLLLSEPEPGSTDAPLEGDLQGIADRLAASGKF